MVYELRCSRADHIRRWRGRAGTEDALQADLGEHVRHVHGVPVLADTTWDHTGQSIRHR